MLVRVKGNTWNTASPFLHDAEAIRLALIQATNAPWTVVKGDGFFAAIPVIKEDTDKPLVLMVPE